MYKIELEIPCDLHGRKAAYFIQEITSIIKSNIYCQKNNREVNAKSLLGILSLGIVNGDQLTFKCDKEVDITNIKNIVSRIV